LLIVIAVLNGRAIAAAADHGPAAAPPAHFVPMIKAKEYVSLTAEVVNSDSALETFVRDNCTTIFHPVGTAKMGPENDPTAVVDQYCRVRGVEGPRVVDVSVMPNIVRPNTNLTCTMIGERVADWMSHAN